MSVRTMLGTLLVGAAMTSGGHGAELKTCYVFSEFLGEVFWYTGRGYSSVDACVQASRNCTRDQFGHWDEEGYCTILTNPTYRCYAIGGSTALGFGQSKIEAVVQASKKCDEMSASEDACTSISVAECDVIRPVGRISFVDMKQILIGNPRY